MLFKALFKNFLKERRYFVNLSEWNELLLASKKLAHQLIRRDYQFTSTDLEVLEDAIFKQIIGPNRKRMRKGETAAPSEVIVLLGILFGETLRQIHLDHLLWVFPEEEAPIEHYDLDPKTKAIQKTTIPYSDAEFFLHAKLIEKENNNKDQEITLFPILRAHKFMHDETDAFSVVEQTLRLHMNKKAEELMNQPTDEEGWVHLNEKSRMRVTMYKPKDDMI